MTFIPEVTSRNTHHFVLVMSGWGGGIVCVLGLYKTWFIIIIHRYISNINQLQIKGKFVFNY